MILKWRILSATNDLDRVSAVALPKLPISLTSTDLKVANDTKFYPGLGENAFLLEILKNNWKRGKHFRVFSIGYQLNRNESEGQYMTWGAILSNLGQCNSHGIFSHGGVGR